MPRPTKWSASYRFANHFSSTPIYRSLPTTVSQLKMCDFSGEILKVLKCYNFLRVQRRQNCSPAASFVNCVMTLYVLKVHLQMFLAMPITKKCQIFSSDTLVTNERYVFPVSLQILYKIFFIPVNI